MKDFSLGQVMDLMRKTSPFLLFRFIIYFCITLCYILITGAGAGIGYGIGMIADNAPAGGMWGGLIGFGIAAAIMYFIREYLLYIVNAGHIAVLVELVEGREIPGGKGQIDYARQQVQERFATSSLLFGMDQLIKGILRAFNRAFLSIASILPIPGTTGAMKFINTIITLSLTYLDEVILAYLMKTRATNPWASSRTAINPEWEAKLESVSDKFKELKDKATRWQDKDEPQPTGRVTGRVTEAGGETRQPG